MMIKCYTPDVAGQPLTVWLCRCDYLTATQKQTVAPFLYLGGLTPTVNIPAPGVGATR